ncbi:MAG: hypothetical protein ACFFA7_12195 [Promethearchaeota archaeon]
MQKHEKPKKKEIRIEISGSETILEKIKKRTPWIFGTWIRKPKYIIPKLKFRKLTLPLPPRSLGFIIIFTILFVLQTGVVYLILSDSSAFGVDSYDNPIFIWPENIHEAFIIESIVASILMFLFSIGFFLLYQATKYVYDKRMANIIMILAIMMILISFFILQFMLTEKIPKPIYNS